MIARIKRTLYILCVGVLVLFIVLHLHLMYRRSSALSLSEVTIPSSASVRSSLHRADRTKRLGHSLKAAPNSKNVSVQIKKKGSEKARKKQTKSSAGKGNKLDKSAAELERNVSKYQTPFVLHKNKTKTSQLMEHKLHQMSDVSKTRGSHSHKSKTRPFGSKVNTTKGTLINKTHFAQMRRKPSNVANMDEQKDSDTKKIDTLIAAKSKSRKERGREKTRTPVVGARNTTSSADRRPDLALTRARSGRRSAKQSSPTATKFEPPLSLNGMPRVTQTSRKETGSALILGKHSHSIREFNGTFPDKQTSHAVIAHTSSVHGHSGGQGSVTDTDQYRPRQGKYLIYLCDHGRSCGGWGDRQRGLVSTFLLAYVTNRRFGINMTLPCDVKNYYVPHEVKWNISEEEIRRKSFRVIDSVGNTSFHDSLTTIDFDKEYHEDVIFLRTNVEHYWSIRASPLFRKALPVWARFGRSRFFREAWNILMKPSSHLQHHLDKLLTECHYFNRASPFVCAHVRIGRSKSNPKDSELRNEVTKLGELWAFLDSYVRNGSHVFIATDNMDVRQMSREKFGKFHHDTGGTIVHVDKERGQSGACQGFESALLDQLTLTRCDVLVTSNSMFSSRAALIRGSNEGLYYFNKGNLTKLELS